MQGDGGLERIFLSQAHPPWRPALAGSLLQQWICAIGRKQGCVALLTSPTAFGVSDDPASHFLQAPCLLHKLLNASSSPMLPSHTSQGPHLLAPTGSDLTGELACEGRVFAGWHYDLNFLTLHGRSRYPGLFVVRQGFGMFRCLGCCAGSTNHLQSYAARCARLRCTCHSQGLSQSAQGWDGVAEGSNNACSAQMRCNSQPAFNPIPHLASIASPRPLTLTSPHSSPT